MVKCCVCCCVVTVGLRPDHSLWRGLRERSLAGQGQTASLACQLHIGVLSQLSPTTSEVYTIYAFADVSNQRQTRWLVDPLPSRLSRMVCASGSIVGSSSTNGPRELPLF